MMLFQQHHLQKKLNDPNDWDNTNYTDKVSIKLNETFTNIDVGE